MLSERIVAINCQQGLGIKISTSEKQLKNAIAIFESQLVELKIFRQTGSVNKQLQKVTKLWKPMKEMASGEINRENAFELRDMAEDLFRASHKVVIMLQDESGSQSGHLVNISGRQRTLSQRISSLYMLQSWGFKSSEYTGDYSQVINEFKGALTELSKAPSNTKAVSNKLEKARKLFAILERSLK